MFLRAHCCASCLHDSYIAQHILEHAACQRAGSSVAVMVCFELSGYLQDHRGTSEETLAQFAHQLVARMEHQQDLGRLRQLATGIPGLWMPASRSGAGRSAERLVKEIEDTKRMTLRSRLAESFAGPAKRISESNAGELIQRLVVVMVMEAGFELRSRVVSGIQTRGGCVSVAKADEFAERHLGSMDRDETVFRLARL